MNLKEAGKRRTVWLPTRLDQKAEKARKILGLGRSGFYRFAIIEIVKDFAQNKIGRSTDRKEEEDVEMLES